MENVCTMAEISKKCDHPSNRAYLNRDAIFELASPHDSSLENTMAEE